MTHLNFAMTTLLNGIWQGALLAAAMWIALKLFPRVNPTTRFTVLWLTLLAVAMLPVGPLALTEPATGLPHASAPIAATNTAATTTFVPVELRQPELAPSTSGSNSQSVPDPRPALGWRCGDSTVRDLRGWALSDSNPLARSDGWVRNFVGAFDPALARAAWRQLPPVAAFEIKSHAVSEKLAGEIDRPVCDERRPQADKVACF